MTQSDAGRPRNGDLVFAAGTAPLIDGAQFAAFVASLRSVPWIVYAKRPFAGPAQVPQYLGPTALLTWPYNPHSLGRRRRRSHAVQFNEIYPHGAANGHVPASSTVRSKPYLLTDGFLWFASDR